MRRGRASCRQTEIIHATAGIIVVVVHLIDMDGEPARERGAPGRRAVPVHVCKGVHNRQLGALGELAAAFR